MASRHVTYPATTKKESGMDDIHIRWMLRRDMPSVLNIENKCFDFAWNENDFIRALRQRNCIGMVAELNDKVVGFMLYELHRNRIHIINFAVHPFNQRLGVGRGMIGKLTGKLSAERRNRIMVEVRESNLDAQLFFRDMRFKAISVIRDFYEDSDEDAYLFQYRYQPTPGDIETTVSRMGAIR